MEVVLIVKYMRIKVLVETGLLLLVEKCIWIFQNGGKQW